MFLKQYQTYTEYTDPASVVYLKVGCNLMLYVIGYN